MKSAKRERSNNFTTDEKAMVLEIAMKYRDVVENKRTNAEVVKLKNEVWQKITEEFNTIQTSGIREVKHVKTLFENLKRKGYGKVMVCNNGEIQNHYGEGYSESSQLEQIPYAEQEPLDDKNFVHEKNFIDDRRMDFLEREREIKLQILQQELENARLQNQILQVNLEIKQIEKRNLQKSS